MKPVFRAHCAFPTMRIGLSSRPLRQRHARARRFPGLGFRPLARDRDEGLDDGRWGVEDELVHGYRSL
jgi:hypothetical protein